MSSSDLPIIDFKKTSQNPGAVADELFQACTKWGTLNLTRVHRCPINTSLQASSMSKTMAYLRST